MNKGCELFRPLIPPALVGELEAADRLRLEAHLAECAACEKELARMSSWIGELGPQNDVPVPRHFFVPARESRRAWGEAVWGFFREPRWAWATSLAVLLVAAAIWAGYPPPAPAPAVPALTQADLESFRAGLMQSLEERSRQEKSQWLAVLRSEMKDFSTALDQRQRVQLTQALGRFEANMGQSLVSWEKRQKDSSSRTNAQILGWLEAQQNSILQLSGQISHVAIRGEEREAQTDATLALLFNKELASSLSQ